ncbi:MAG: amidohydrolase, partial [Terracidiphilus sp.]
MRQLPLATLLLACAVFAAATAHAQSKPGPLDDVISVHAPVFVLNHVRVIDGTGAPARDDQAVVVVNGRIQSIAPAASAAIPAGAQVLDRSGFTVIPGLVGMHDHL